MAYSNIMLKGRIGYNTIGWPLIVMERAKSDNPQTPVLCEVWGYEHECGSVYYNEIVLADDLNAWKEAVIRFNGNPDKHYFKGKLVTL